MYDTRTILPDGDAALPLNDIIETQNHFHLFNFMLDSCDESLTADIIKSYHRILKSSTTDVQLSWFAVGDYKKQANIVGILETTAPKDVPGKIQSLLQDYRALSSITFQDIIDFHYRFECIHPFQDGNGRVGRMIMFRECLRNDIMPFIIEDEKKAFYYRGLQEYSRKPGYLLDTCLDAQNHYDAYYQALKIDEIEL